MGDASFAETPPARPSFDRFGRRSTETFVALVGSAGANSLFFLVVARTLGPSGTGVVSILVFLVTMLGMAVFGTLNLANVYFGVRDPESRSALLANSLLVAVFAGTALSLVVLWTLTAAGETFGARDTELALALAAVPFAAAHRLVATVILAGGRSLAFNVVTALAPTAALVLVGVTFAVLGPSVRLAAVSLLVSNVAVLAVALAVAGLAPSRPSRRLLSSSFRYGLRAYPGTIIQVFNTRIDVFFVSAIRGASAAGIYTTAVVLAELVWRISWAAGVILFGRVAGEDDAPIAFTLRVARAVVFLMTLGAAAIALASRVVVLPLLGEDFSEAFVPLLLLLPGAVALGLLNVIVSDLAGRGLPQYTSYAAGLGLAVTALLSPPLIWAYAAPGASIASSISYTVATVFAVLVLSRRFAVRPGELLVLRRGDLAAPGLRLRRRP